MNIIDHNADTLRGAPRRSTSINFRKRSVAGIDSLVGARLRLVRESAGASRREMAAALGISVQQLAKYEVGSNRISVGFLFQAALFLRVPIQHLLVVADDDTQPAGFHSEEDEKAVMRFVTRNIDSIGARKSLVSFLSDLLRMPDAASAAGSSPDHVTSMPMSGD